MNKIDETDTTTIGIFKGLDLAVWKIIKEMADMDSEWTERTIKNTLQSILKEKKGITEKSRKVNESQIDFLKLCPCCGSTKIHVVAPDDGCYCWDCGLTMPNRPNWRERWNRRVKE